MPWKTRVRGEQLYHHIYAWGNGRHPVFKEDYHYKQYLSLLGKYCREYNIDIIAYALMQWHVHLFIFDQKNKVSVFVFRMHGDYAQYFNKNTHRVGHVFGERFNNKIVQANKYGIWLSRYIHRQPLDAGLTDDPKTYPWTSYRKYIGLEDPGFLKHDIIINQFGNANENAAQQYTEFVMSDDNGPINWSNKKISIGVDEFVLSKARSLYDVSTRQLIEPHGADERQKRQFIIIDLHEKFGYSAYFIAKVFHMSNSMVAKIFKKSALSNTE